jgi:arylsulfatase
VVFPAGVNPRRGDAWQLFDLEADGTETTNLAKENPGVVERLARRFEEWQNRVGDLSR